MLKKLQGLVEEVRLNEESVVMDGEQTSLKTIAYDIMRTENNPQRSHWNFGEYWDELDSYGMEQIAEILGVDYDDISHTAHLIWDSTPGGYKDTNSSEAAMVKVSKLIKKVGAAKVANAIAHFINTKSERVYDSGFTKEDVDASTEHPWVIGGGKRYTLMYDTGNEKIFVSPITTKYGDVDVPEGAHFNEISKEEFKKLFREESQIYQMVAG